MLVPFIKPHSFDCLLVKGVFNLHKVKGRDVILVNGCNMITINIAHLLPNGNSINLKGLSIYLDCTVLKSMSGYQFLSGEVVLSPSYFCNVEVSLVGTVISVSTRSDEVTLAVGHDVINISLEHGELGKVIVGERISISNLTIINHKIIGSHSDVTNVRV